MRPSCFIIKQGVVDKLPSNATRAHMHTGTGGGGHSGGRGGALGGGGSSLPRFLRYPRYYISLHQDLSILIMHE